MAAVDGGPGPTAPGLPRACMWPAPTAKGPRPRSWLPSGRPRGTAGGPPHVTAPVPPQGAPPDRPARRLRKLGSPRPCTAAVLRSRPLQPSFFEALLALSFLFFAEAGVDLAVVEVGLGGRLDATNILTPRLALITHIGLRPYEPPGPYAGRHRLGEGPASSSRGCLY